MTICRRWTTTTCAAADPTVHKAFDDATAILAGDALLTLAFDVMARTEVHPDAAVRTALVLELARASGLGGMAGGQMLDLAAEGRFESKRALSENEIITLQAMKTGALIRFACNAGAHPRQGRRRGTRKRSRATVPQSARHSRSPTTCSTSKATPRRWAKPPARMQPPARRRLSRLWASTRRARRSTNW